MTLIGAANGALLIGPDGRIRRYNSALSRWPHATSITIAERDSLTVGNGLFVGFEIQISDLPGVQTYTASGWATAGSSVSALTLSPAGSSINAPIGSSVAVVAVTATGGTAPYTFSYTGTLPPGTALSSGGIASGAVTGTVANIGNVHTAVVTATDSLGAIGTATYVYTITASSGSLTLSPAGGALNAANGTNVSGDVITASGGTAPYTFAFTGAFPTGTTLSTAGAASGIVADTIGATRTAVVTATDSVGRTGTATYVYTILGASTLTLSPSAGAINAPLATSVAGMSVTASGGTGPYTYTYTGSFPPGTSFSTGGVASGTVTGTVADIGDTYTVTVTATDSLGAIGVATYVYTITAASGALTLSPSAGAINAPLESSVAGMSVTASGGTAPYTYAYTGTFPPGTSFSTAGAASGSVTGTIANIGNTHTAVVTATDNLGRTGTATYVYTITAASGSLTLAPATGTFNAPVGTNVSGGVITASGGTSPVTFSVSGSFPVGASLSSAGYASGTITGVLGVTYVATVTATDNVGRTGSAVYTYNVI